jgi:hypothetical protein
VPYGLHEVVFGVTGQPLVHVPTVPVSGTPTYVIENTEQGPDSNERELDSGNADVDGLSLTLDDDAGQGTANPRRIPVATVGAAAVGTVYAVVAADGRVEPFTCEAVGADYLEAGNPLSGSYTTNDTVVGLQLSADFPDAEAADEDLYDDDPPLRVSWTYTVRGGSVTVHEPIRLVRNKGEWRYLGTAEQALRSDWPELVMQAGRHHNAVRDVVRYAARRLQSRLRSRGVSPGDFLAGDKGHELLVARAALHMADSGFHPRTRDAEAFRVERRDEFNVLWTDLIVGHPGRDVVEVDRDDVATSNQATRHGRLIRRA